MNNEIDMLVEDAPVMKHNNIKCKLNCKDNLLSYEYNVRASFLLRDLLTSCTLKTYRLLTYYISASTPNSIISQHSST